MQANTGAWKALPEIPWGTQAGATYKELGRQAARLLADIRAKLDSGNPTELTLLADQLGDVHDDLRALAKSEIVAVRIYSAGQASAYGGRRPVPRDHLRLLPDPDRDDDPPGGAPLQFAGRPRLPRP